MKNLSFVLTLATAVGALLTAESAVRPKESTPEEKAARAERRLRALNETGGFIADPRNAKGKYIFIDCSTGVDPAVQKAAAYKCQNSCMILTDLTSVKLDAPFSFKKGGELFSKCGGLMATIMIDDDNWPMEVVCPSARWIVINIRPLKADNPAKPVFETRVRKLMSRSVGQLFQAGYAFSSISTMNLIRDAKDFDKIATEGLATECTTVVQTTAEKFGFTTMKRVLYRKACEEGWAPPPVNEFQKSAWDKVHSIPANPMKIEFDSKKGE